MLKRVLEYAHTLLSDTVHTGDVVIDGTAGKGKDTLFLSQLVGEDGHVYAMDIQVEAIFQTKQLLAAHKRTNVTLIHDSHSQLTQYIAQENIHSIGGAIFNLGYLPGGDKSIITQPESTLQAIEAILPYLREGRLVILVVYPGHEGGQEEEFELLKALSGFKQKEYNVLRYGFINQQNNPPFILAIEKK
ncbi:class I SAM-dependent methyltransferase [Bacillaceae bacterium S4-13-58]